jgi:AbrB family looped-hinge helix DNA binding protein
MVRYDGRLIDQEGAMSAVMISPKFQVVIPKETREKLHLKAGQRMEVLDYENRIELIPLKPMKQLRGFLKGIQTDIPRDKDRV